MKGLPAGCNATAAIKAIGLKVGEIIDDSDIDICYMVETSNGRANNFIVRFTRCFKCNALLAKARKARLTTHSLDYEGPSRFVFIIQHLMRENKQLLGAAISRKRVGWKYVWSTNGKVLACQGDSTPILRIASMSDVDCMSAASPITETETDEGHE